VLDLDLLRSFVSVVDAGGFTRAGERVHRTQSTVSQQIRRLEETLGRVLLHRTGKHATPTEEGERLLSYARRILALAEEARDVVARPGSDGVVRLGIPEDFAAANRLTRLLSRFARSRPGLRLDVRCDLSVKLRSDLERGAVSDKELAVAGCRDRAGRIVGIGPGADDRAVADPPGGFAGHPASRGSGGEIAVAIPGNGTHGPLFCGVASALLAV